MSDPNSNAAPAEPAPFLEIWARCLGHVLGQIGGSTVSCAVLAEIPPEVAPENRSDWWALATLSGGLRGEMSLRMAAAAVVHFAQLLMGEPAAAPAEMTAEHREAALELVRQVAGLVSTSLAGRWGEVPLRIEAAAAPPTWAASATACLRVGDDLAPFGLIELNLSAALMAALRNGGKAAASVDPASAQRGDADNSVNLGLLMDVELDVELRFGRRRLLLRDVLELGPGAVVELDRQVNEPVDLILDGRLLARGEVVVMDGNYALRVTEVAPQGS